MTIMVNLGKYTKKYTIINYLLLNYNYALYVDIFLKFENKFLSLHNLLTYYERCKIYKPTTKSHR